MKGVKLKKDSVGSGSAGKWVGGKKGDSWKGRGSVGWEGVQQDVAQWEGGNCRKGHSKKRVQ